MSKTVSIGNQDFESIIANGYFYVDKTDFIREWRESGDCRSQRADSLTR